MHNDNVFQSVLIVYAKYYEYRTMFDETTAPKIWHIFFCDILYKTTIPKA